MRDFPNFENTFLYKAVKAKKIFKNEYLFKCYNATAVMKTLLYGNGISMSASFVIILSVILLFLLFKNSFLKKLSFKFKKIFARLISILEIFFSMMGISLFVITLNLIVGKANLLMKIYNFSVIYDNLEKEATNIIDFLSKSKPSNIEKYKKIFGMSKKFIQTIEKMVDPLIKGTTMSAMLNKLDISHEESMAKIAEKMIVGKIHDASNIIDKIMTNIDMINNFYVSYMPMFYDMINFAGGAINIMIDIINYSKKFSIFFVLNVIVLQYVIMIILCLFIIKKTSFFIKTKRHFKYLFGLYFFILYFSIIIKHMIATRSQYFCYYFSDLERDLTPIKYYIHSSDSLMDEHQCFAQWSNVKATRISPDYTKLTQLLKNCVFKEEPEKLGGLYKMIHTSEKEIIQYINKGYDILKIIRPVFYEWDDVVLLF